MIFAARNGFKLRYLKEFWGKGTGDAFLLTKDLKQPKGLRG